MAKPATGVTGTVAEPTPVSSSGTVSTRQRYRGVLDRVARWVIGMGGVSIVAVILAILLVLLVEVAPLFQSPAARYLGSVTVPPVTLPVKIGVDEYREISFIADPAGLKIISLRDGSELAHKSLPSLDNVPPGPPGGQVGRNPTFSPSLGQDGITAISEISQGKFALGTRSGKVIFGEVKFDVTFVEGGRKTQPDAVFSDPLELSAGQPLGPLAYAELKDGKLAVAAVSPRELVIARITEQKALVGPSTFSQQTSQLPLEISGEISALAADNRAEDIFIGTTGGELARVDLRGSEPKYTETTATNSGAPITALGLLLGDRTLVAGDSGGNVSSWQLLAAEGGDSHLQRIHDFAAHSTAVTVISPSSRDKGFLTGDSAGGIKLHYGTTGQTRLGLRLPDSGLQSIAYAPRADGFVAMGAGGAISHYGLENRHPEVTLGSLFGKVWYEGNPGPDHTWQSTGGADDFEGKFSLVPLIYGTLKGSFYSLLLAVPLAILAALYCSQFVQERWKNFIKPTVEIMAGLPSVVLGFIAALWLAPNVETVLPGLLVTPLVLTVFIIGAAFVWSHMPARLRLMIKPGRELIALIPVIGLGVWLSLGMSNLLAVKLLGGDYHSWLATRLGLDYDQRNSLVVSIAMGFAVIPIIFTIAEDAFSSVPRHLVLAGRALGANKWQTALRVVVPTASPGIFSAIMVGLGRAVGETMIVLMATGNTPIMSWNIFNGFRALSANIAVELPEAPAGGSLFRVLFLSALLLFLLTFLLNTVAEVVRLRLRRRYSSL